MNIDTTTTSPRYFTIQVPPTPAIHVLRFARNRVRRSVSLTRELLEGLELIEEALSSKIQGKEVDEDVVTAVGNICEEFAFEFAEEAMSEGGEQMLGRAYGAEELDHALKALDHFGQWGGEPVDSGSEVEAEGLGLKEYTPSICLHALKERSAARDEDDGC